MNKLHFEIEKYHSHFSSPLPVRGKMVSMIENFTFSFNDEQGLTFSFSAFSLPGLHQLSLLEMGHQLKSFFQTNRLRLSDIRFDHLGFNTVEPRALSYHHPESLFLIESALYLYLQKKNEWMNPEIKQNELYQKGGDYSQSSCLKIKISPGDSDEKFVLLAELITKNPRIHFRLDGNRQFETEDFLKWWKKAEKLCPTLRTHLDYFEEPLKIFAEQSYIFKEWQLPLAYDESAHSLINHANEKLFDLSTVVLKPGLFGFSQLIKCMHAHPEKRIIISSCFEHESLRPALLKIASHRPLEFHGLTCSSFSVT